jgi:hypothetical protein
MMLNVAEPAMAAHFFDVAASLLQFSKKENIISSAEYRQWKFIILIKKIRLDKMPVIRKQVFRFYKKYSAQTHIGKHPWIPGHHQILQTT